MAIDSSIIGRLADRLAAELGGDRLADDEAVTVAYATDSSRRRHLPQLVVWPQGEAEVAKALAAASELAVPVHVRGMGSATTGASLAEAGGVVLSTERMRAIRQIDVVTRTATVEPGVLNGELERRLAEHRLFWPPDPSSREFSSIGGNLGTAAAGPRGLRYGGVRENVLGVRAVCGDGSVVASGARVPKSSAGYDLARLLVGSEGTLAVITEAVLKLAPRPAATKAAVALFADSDQALAAVARIMATAVTPAALEFLDEGCLQVVRDGDAGLLPDAAGAMLLLAVDADSQASAAEQLAALRAAVGAGDEVVRYDECEPGAGLWQARKVMSQRLKQVASRKINEDIVVPVPALGEVIAFVRDSCASTGIANLNFGHAGVGNLHVNLLFDPDQEGLEDQAGRIVGQLMAKVVAADGSISGEHGIGIAKRQFLPLQVDPATAATMRAIKRIFDPAGILNPGKLVDVDADAGAL